MRLIIEVDIITDIPPQAEPFFAKAAVQSLEANLNGNTIIEEALKAGAKFGTTANAGRRSIRVEGDPVIYGVRE